MAFSVLKMAGADPDPTPLRQFEKKDCFTCFHYERDSSISANIHVLEALKGVDDEATEKVRKWLSSSRTDHGYWIDKWHVSPYYPTAHAVIALIGVDHDLARSAIQWIMSTQRVDGGWGYYNRSTAEETAYCLQALSIYSREVEPIDRNVIERARRCLLASDDKMPDMWIARCLYTPTRIVESAIYSALTLAMDYLYAA
jgi:halimadienyl-diphosphate synthase